jgi:hypothetical protein
MNLLTQVRSRWITTAIIAVALVASASIASAFTLRSPQIVFNNGSVQAYLNANDGGINTATDQVDGQVWTTSVSGNATFTLMIELAGFAPSNDIGVYNAGGPPAPALYLVFPGAASAGWFATCHFNSTGGLVVNLFDDNSNLIGQNTYAGVTRNNFGFYLNGPAGLFYSQDARNAGGLPQMLTFAGTGDNYGDYWEVFEDIPQAQSDHDFDDAILLIQSVNPTPANTRTWGSIKSLYK